MADEPESIDNEMPPPPNFPMTSKKKTAIPPTASIKAVPGTKYVVIDGKFVARLLKPTIRGVEPKEYFNIFLPGKESMTQLTAGEIAQLDPTTTASSTKTNE